MAIRRELFRKATVDRLIGFENAKRYWFPDNDSRLKFCFYTAQLTGETNALKVAFNVKTLDQLVRVQSGTFMRLPVSLVSEFSPEALAIMDFASQMDIDIASKMYERWPKFGDEEAGPPHREYMREVDMGTDRELFTDDSAGIPVFEGRMVDQYDYRAKVYRSGRGRSSVWEPVPFGSPTKSIQPQWYILADKVPEKVAERMKRYRIGFCDVASPTNERSLIAALIPPNTVCGHKVPTVMFAEGMDWAYLIWLSVANSFTIDFLVRKKVSLSMSYTLMDSLPFPRLTLANPHVPRIADLVLRLSCTGAEMIQFWNRMAKHGWVAPILDSSTSPGISDVPARLAARAEIEAIVARDLYGLSRDELAYILDQFPIVRRYDERDYGEFRTKRLCLEAYDASANHPAISRSARRDGALAMTPGGVPNERHHADRTS